MTNEEIKAKRAKVQAAGMHDDMEPADHGYAGNFHAHAMQCMERKTKNIMQLFIDNFRPII